MISNALMLWWRLCYVFLRFFLPYSVMLCTMYLYFSVQVSTVYHEWNDDFCACGRPMGHLFFSSFHMSFSLFCINYSCCILLYMGSMFIYISWYILWEPAIKTIIIIIIIINYCHAVCLFRGGITDRFEIPLSVVFKYGGNICEICPSSLILGTSSQLYDITRTATTYATAVSYLPHFFRKVVKISRV